MIRYEFYRRARDPHQEDDLIGVLPERRKDPRRITPESVINWGKLLVPAEDISYNRIYYVQTHYEESPYHKGK